MTDKPHAATSGLYQLYQAAPQRCFDALEVALTEYQQQIAELSERYELLDDLFGNTVKTLAKRPQSSRLAAGWTADLRQPNILLAGCFHPKTDFSTAERWVDASGVLRLGLILPRNVQYDLTVRVGEFVRPEYEQSFFVQIGRWRYPWLMTADRRYETIILEEPAERETWIQIGVDPNVRSESEPTFSVREIEIRQRG